jgi:hypothetical protein
MANGVPPLLNQAAYVANTAALLAGDALVAINMFKPSGWGVFAYSADTGIGAAVFEPVSAASQIASAVTGGILNPLNLRSGSRAKQPDSIISKDYKREYRISDAPQELGAFQSYNKVQRPATIHLRMAKGGSASDRDAFLNWVEENAAGTQLYAIVSPESSYPSYNIQSYDYRQTATDGAGIIIVDVEFLEIRQTVTSQLGSAPTQTTARPLTGTPPTVP